jgi:hypothetical protein
MGFLHLVQLAGLIGNLDVRVVRLKEDVQLRIGIAAGDLALCFLLVDLLDQIAMMFSGCAEHSTHIGRRSSVKRIYDSSVR